MANEPIDTANFAGVGVLGDEIVLLFPPKRMTRTQALVLAAYLVVLADAEGHEFVEALEAIET